MPNGSTAPDLRETRPARAGGLCAPPSVLFLLTVVALGAGLSAERLAVQMQRASHVTSATVVREWSGALARVVRQTPADNQRPGVRSVDRRSSCGSARASAPELVAERHPRACRGLVEALTDLPPPSLS